MTYSDFQQLCLDNKVPDFKDKINIRDKSKDIFYFNNVEYRGEQIGNLPTQKVIQPYGHRTFYCEAMFPFISRDKLIP